MEERRLGGGNKEGVGEQEDLKTKHNNKKKDWVSNNEKITTRNKQKMNCLWMIAKDIGGINSESG